MQNRFIFIEEEVVTDWHLDESTRNTGKQGIAAARATLAACRGHELSAAA